MISHGRVLVETLRAKVSVAAKAVRMCSNWPMVLGAAASWHVEGLAKWLPTDLVVRTRDGTVVAAPSTAQQGWPVIEVLVDDSYQLGRLAFDAKQDLPLRVLDVGSHVGSFAVAVAKRLPAAEVLCFEPSPKAATYLQRNLDVNELSGSVTVRTAALGPQGGTGQLLSGEACSCSATLVPALASAGAAKLDITVVGLAEAIEEFGPPDLVKLDCEGGEYGIVLETDRSLWASVRCILLEYHPVPGHSWDELAAHLGGLGFRVGWHEPGNPPGQGMAMLHR